MPERRWRLRMGNDHADVRRLVAALLILVGPALGALFSQSIDPAGQ